MAKFDRLPFAQTLPGRPIAKLFQGGGIRPLSVFGVAAFVPQMLKKVLNEILQARAKKAGSMDGL